MRFGSGGGGVQLLLREPVVAAEADAADKKQKQKKQKKPDKPAAPKDKTAPPANAPAPAEPAQQG